MKLLPIEECGECKFNIFYTGFYMGLGYVCVHLELIKKYPDPEDRPIGIPFRHDCPLEDTK
jgi:hypothetical protein